MSLDLKSQRTLVLGALTLCLLSPALMPSAAQAADLDAPYVGSQQFPEDKVEFGSGWYIRGDMAATRLPKIKPIDPQLAGPTYITPNGGLGYDASLAGGYKLNTWFRADLMADFHEPQTTVYGSLNAYDVLVNGYVDLGTWYHVTPYIGAGAGMSFGHAAINDYGNTYHAFAWALMAGFGIDVYDHTKLDIGYRYLNLGTIPGATIKTLGSHEFRVGVRYMIDD